MARFLDHPVSFIKSVASEEALPSRDFNEVAFLGRSNVGKSSLINALMLDKTLCKTSGTPGHTQMLNFFSIGDQGYVVDMPGYGYAKAPKNLVKNWQGLIPLYLQCRPNLKRLFILIDSRHGIKEIDETYMSFMDKIGVSYQIVLTKTDKIKQAELEVVKEKTLEKIQKRPAAHPEILLTSSDKGTGLKELRNTIRTLVFGT